MTYEEIALHLERDLLAAITAAYGGDVSVPQVKVSIPTDKDKADFVTNAAFLLSKQVQQSPLAVAETIVAQLVGHRDGDRELYIARAAAPGFINFKLSDGLLQQVLTAVLAAGADFGRNDSLDGQTWVIEHTSPNPNKAMHVGHLRNNLIGMSVAEILAFSGAKVIRDSIDNDRGIAIAKAMWGYLEYKRTDGAHGKDVTYWSSHRDEWLTPEAAGSKPDHFVGDCYTLASEAAKADPAVDAAIRQMALLWERHDADVWALWELIVGYAHQGIDMTMERVGSHWDTVWHEHEHYEQGRDLVLAGLEKGVFQRLDDGAVLTHLEDYKLPDTIAIKSDGTSLYITQDIALTKLKKETYQADKLIWVIGPEQSVAMKQVFAICEQLGIGSRDDFIHLPYGLVSILDENGSRKKMSSRGGNTLLIDDLIDEVAKVLLSTDRGYDEHDAERIAISAIKYAMLKPARTTNTVIDIKQAISLDGDSGLYLLYTIARTNTLQEKAGGQPDDREQTYAFNDSERDILKKLLYFPEKVRLAAEHYSPNILVEYALDIAHDFNALYAKERFITDDPQETAKKLAVNDAVRQVLLNCLRLLHIDTVSKI